MAADNPLWDYALERYAREGARELCLLLQDEAGVDVAFLFACGYLRRMGATGEQMHVILQRALTATRELRVEVLAPVRAARRALKRVSAQPDAEAVRDRIKRAELAIERLCFDWIDDGMPKDADGVPKLDVREALDVYAKLAGIGFDARSERALGELATILY